MLLFELASDEGIAWAIQASLNRSIYEEKNIVRCIAWRKGMRRLISVINISGWSASVRFTDAVFLSRVQNFVVRLIIAVA
jgi:hypothetical protein